MHLQTAVDNELKRLVECGVIEGVEATDWLAPIVGARKGNGDICLCVDLRALNKEAVVDRFPLPNIEEMITTFTGAKVFSTLDLMTAYHQVELHESSKDLTAFTTPFGIFCFKRMPFGLISAAAVFQRIMSVILKDQLDVKCYQDNIIIFGSNNEEHDQRFRQVLKKLQVAGLTLKAKKCRFSVSKVSCLGTKLLLQGSDPRKNLWTQ